MAEVTDLPRTVEKEEMPYLIRSSFAGRNGLAGDLAASTRPWALQINVSYSTQGDYTHGRTTDP